MFPFYSSIYQSASPRTAAEQREADVRVGELAAAFAELRRSLWAPARALRRFLHRPTPDEQVGLAAHRCSHPVVPYERRALPGGQPCQFCEPTAC
jgi:hypothetical protein